MRKLLNFLILLVALGFPPAADPPKAIEFQVEIRSKGDGIESREQSTIAWWDRRWAESSPEGALIFDLAEDRCVLIDHVHKIWTGGTVNGFLMEMEREITNLAGKVQASYGLARKETPPGEKPVPVKVESLGIDEKDGRKCLHYRIFAGTELKEELWLDPALKPAAYLPLEKFLPALNRFSGITAIFGRELRNPRDFQTEQAIQAELARLFPLGLEIRSLEYRAGKLTYEKRVSDVREWSGDATRFQPPADYRKVTYREYLDASLPDVKDPLGSENEKE
jgi:hypothetical protein